MGWTLALGAVHGRYHYTADRVLGAIVGVGSFTVVSLLVSQEKTLFLCPLTSRLSFCKSTQHAL